MPNAHLDARERAKHWTALHVAQTISNTRNTRQEEYTGNLSVRKWAKAPACLFVLQFKKMRPDVPCAFLKFKKMRLDVPCAFLKI